MVSVDGNICFYKKTCCFGGNLNMYIPEMCKYWEVVRSACGCEKCLSETFNFVFVNKENLPRKF